MPFYNKQFWERRNEGIPEYQGKINWWDISQAFDEKLLFFVHGANIVFTFDCQFALVSVYDSLRDKSIKQLYKLNLYGIIVICTILTIVAMIGFLTNPIHQEELLIFRNALSPHSIDIFMTVGKIIICLCILCDISINYNQIRLSAFKFLFNTGKFTQKQ